MAKELIDRILKTEKVSWRNIQPLQPDNFKNIINYNHLEQSILKHGFTNSFYVWENKGVLYSIDGVTRKEVLSNIENVPELLSATFIKAKDRKEAIAILLDVFNQKENRIDKSILTEWLEVEEIEIEEINVDSLNVEWVQEEEDIEHESNVKELTNMIAVSLTDEEQEIWLHTKEKIGIKKDKNVIFELIKKYSNENNID